VRRPLLWLVFIGFLFNGFCESVVNAQGPDRLQVLVRERRWNEALPVAEEAATRQPDNGLAFYTLGTILHNQRQFVQAHRALRRAEQILPESPEVHRLLGLNYYLLQQYRLFEEQMLKARALKPGDSEFDYWLGRYHQMVSGDCDKAISFFSRAISVDNSNYKALYNRGECYDGRGDIASAEKDYLAAINLIRERAVSESWPFQALANLYLRTRRDDEALTLANEAVAMKANVEENHFVLGKVLSERGDTSGAIRELQRATQLDPTDTRARYQLYRLLLQTGDLEAGKTELAAYRELIATYQVGQGIK
jgi:tetratricopeptide (TPR) repeat protein